MFLRKVLSGAVLAGIVATASAAAAQKNVRTIPLTVPAGVPLRVELVKRLRIKRAGAPVEGRLLKPVYVFDRKVIPAGTEVDGRVARLDPVPRGRRIRALANGDFTPFRRVHIEFQTLVLPDGRRLAIRTAVSPGAASVVHLVAGGAKKKKRKGLHARAAEVRRQVKAQEQQTVQAIRAPGKVKRLEGMLAAQLPFHRQTIPAGTRYVAELTAPLKMGSEQRPARAFAHLGQAIPPQSTVEVWLKTPLSSAHDHRGTKVEAVVARPVFTAQHQLVLPEGSRLEGSVTAVRPARHFSRNGRLRFTFRRIELPHRAPKAVTASLKGAEVPRAAHMKIDSEGEAHAVSSKKRLILPALEVMLATSSFDNGDSQQRALQESTNGDPGQVAGGAVRGGVGFGLVGSVIGLVARSQAVSAGFAIYGAGWTVYSRVLGRGRDVVFPKDAAMEIQFGRKDKNLGPPPHAKKFVSRRAAGAQSGTGTRAGKA